MAKEAGQGLNPTHPSLPSLTVHTEMSDAARRVTIARLFLRRRELPNELVDAILDIAEKDLRDLLALRSNADVLAFLPRLREANPALHAQVVSHLDYADVPDEPQDLHDMTVPKLRAFVTEHSLHMGRSSQNFVFENTIPKVKGDLQKMVADGVRRDPATGLTLRFLKELRGDRAEREVRLAMKAGPWFIPMSEMLVVPDNPVALPDNNDDESPEARQVRAVVRCRKYARCSEYRTDAPDRIRQRFGYHL